MAFAEPGAQCAQAAVADNEGCQCLILAFDEVDLPCVTESAGAAGGIVQQRGDGLGQRVRGCLVHVAAEFVESVPAVKGAQEGRSGERPDPVGFPVGERVQEEVSAEGSPSTATMSKFARTVTLPVGTAGAGVGA
nr:hypothetical protein [Streptomyces sp.]